LEQLAAMRSLGENWDGYGAAPPRADLLEIAGEFVEFLLALRPGASPSIHVSPTRDSGVLVEWADAVSDHEVEIHPDGSLGFLHMNRTTAAVETRRFVPDKLALLQPGLLQELRQLVAA
jgi:hypothetical protein